LKAEDKDNIALNYVLGVMVVMGLFEPITLIAIYLKLSFTLLVNVMQMVWIVLSIASIVLNYKRLFRIILKAPQLLRSFSVVMAVVILFILFQAYVYIGYEHVDDDDAFFVATATTTLENNNLYVNSAYSGGEYGTLPTRYILSPFSIYYAVMAKLTGLHPAIYAHLYLPVLMLLLVYFIYYIWGKVLFHDTKSVGIFLFFICVMNLFGNYSEFTTQSFLLLRLWQGKAVLAAGIIPFLLYICYRLTKDGDNKVLWLGMIMSTSAACLVSSMGIFLTPITIGCWALIELVRSRRVKNLLKYITCCLPCVICGIIYVIIS
jgi:hypothetical protein